MGGRPPPIEAWSEASVNAVYDRDASRMCAGHRDESTLVAEIGRHMCLCDYVQIDGTHSRPVSTEHVKFWCELNVCTDLRRLVSGKQQPVRSDSHSAVKLRGHMNHDQSLKS